MSTWRFFADLHAAFEDSQHRCDIIFSSMRGQRKKKQVQLSSKKVMDTA